MLLLSVISLSNATTVGWISCEFWSLYGFTPHKTVQLFGVQFCSCRALFENCRMRKPTALVCFCPVCVFWTRGVWYKVETFLLFALHAELVVFQLFYRINTRQDNTICAHFKRTFFNWFSVFFLFMLLIFFSWVLFGHCLWFFFNNLFCFIFVVTLYR